jgi:hypothetical protein
LGFNDKNALKLGKMLKSEEKLRNLTFKAKNVKNYAEKCEKTFKLKI